MAPYQFTILLILGLISLLAALLLVFKPKFPGAVAAYIAVFLLHASTHIYLTTSTLVFWACATVIVAVLHYLQPKGEPKESRASNLYIGLGGIAGLMAGLAIDARVMILGVIVGVFLGLIAYTRTPNGRWLKFPTFTFIQYFCAKALSAIVAIAIVGLAIEGFIIK
ncbi:MAG: hypothetical protein ACI308_02380 [Muribaculaceae bacterium]